MFCVLTAIVPVEVGMLLSKLTIRAICSVRLTFWLVKYLILKKWGLNCP